MAAIAAHRAAPAVGCPGLKTCAGCSTNFKPATDSWLCSQLAQSSSIHTHFVPEALAHEPTSAMAPKAEKKPAAKKVAVKKATGAGGKAKRAASKAETYKVLHPSRHLGLGSCMG